MSSSSSTLAQFVRHGGNRLSARFEKELEKLRPGDRTSEPVVSTARCSSLEQKHLTVPLMSNHVVQDDDEKAEEVIKERSCVICLGSTGAGKSSTISKFTLQNAKSSSGTHRETKKCGLYQRMSEPEMPVWVDTVGWDDADCEDEDSFKDVLRFIDQNDITKVEAIVWNVIPNVRRDALLTKQAKLIDMFKSSDIWDNVIIVLKQSMNPEVDGKGAIMAALEHNPYSKIQVVGYRFMKDPTITDQQRVSLEDPTTRQVFNVKTDDEIRKIMEDKLDGISNPIKVVFKDRKCIDCGQIGDARLMNAFCHMEMQRIHPGDVERHHPRSLEYFHPNDNHIAEHDGFLQLPWYALHCGASSFLTKRYSCCKRKGGKPGCVTKWACCHKPLKEDVKRGCRRRHKCCKVDEERRNDEGCQQIYSCCRRKTATTGCSKICKKCDKPWGTEAGNCFKVSSHNIKDLAYVDPEEEESHDDIESADEESEVKIIVSPETDNPPAIIYHVF